MGPLKMRVDQVLVERGIAESRHKAQALLLAGQVLVNEQKIEKPGHRIDLEAAIRIVGETPFASRAGAKLQAALDSFQIPVTDRICVDLGASTGGFTDCLLQNGAREVHAFDVGKGQLAWKLRSDPRVVVHDDYNVRHLAGDDLPQSVTLVTVDLSFISLTKVLGPVKAALRARAGNVPVDLISLVKPQFEVGKGQVGKGGVVRNTAKRLAAVESTAEYARSIGFVVEGIIPSPVPGTKGNEEFLMYLKLPPDLSSTL
jgi:23S rRNA (cytidine1920-2'-O)/16S rRNA (cytidine1409-2'-O)-methyltransferase